MVICKREHSLDEQGRSHHISHPNRKEIEGGIPRIVPDILYERAQRKLETNQVELSHVPDNPEAHLLSGHIRCGTCGRRLCNRTMRRQQYVWQYYYCSNRRNKYNKCLDIPVVRADLVNKIAWDACCRLFERLDLIQARIEQELERSASELLEDTQGK